MRQKKDRGFTIIELMITIAVVAILVTVAAPNMSDFLQRNQLNSYVFDVVGAVAATRSEAVTRGERVSFRSKTSSDWSDGWQIILSFDASVIREGEGFPRDSYSMNLTDSSGTAIYEFSIDSRGKRSGNGNFSLQLNDGLGHNKSLSIPVYGSPIAKQE
ncbi:GspH/FimT family pseudopilin [Gynuella sunshinyii]|uniref:Type II secretion system protein H n=1 Tax=Gynuella sunshinyii YC6258 TaxID=1445510 RepID=A0A0C5VS02_9GAMM|nr:GspH/FimT family pseudopilin [Gynuella sunshinyii]AJQ97427.1 tfp pilus assembly protein FimT [Gynuella sunshinyii YC6258]